LSCRIHVNSLILLFLEEDFRRRFPKFCATSNKKIL
jgi:hypothetical protein